MQNAKFKMQNLPQGLALSRKLAFPKKGKGDHKVVDEYVYNIKKADHVVGF